MANSGQKLGTVFVELALDSSEFTRGEQKILQSAKTTSLNIETNFKNVGTRSDQYFTMMRQSVTNSLDMIKNKAGTTASEMVRAQEAAARKIADINRQQYGEHVSLTDKLKRNWQEVAAAAAMAYGAFSAGKAAINAALQMERINISMKAVTDNATLAAREIQYLKEESNRLGLVFADTSAEYVKFAAAAKNTALEGEATRRVFTGLAEAGTALKLNQQDMSLIFMAATQMMSKGVVSMEELRRQMGERLPGAIRLAAEGMHLTTQELIAQIEKGDVLASDLLPALADQLHKTYGQSATEAAQQGQAAINRFNNALFETKAAVGDSLMPVFTDVLNFIKSALPYVTAFVGGIKMMTVDLAAFIDKIRLRDKLLKENKFVSDYDKGAAEIDRIANETKLGIYGQLNPGVSSQKTSTELAAESARATEAAKREADARLRLSAAKTTQRKATAKLSEAEREAIRQQEELAREMKRAEDERIRELESIDKEIVSLSAEVNMFGKSKREVELYQLALKGATTEQLALADALLKTREEQEKWKAIEDFANEVARESRSITKEVKNDFDELAQAIEGWGRDSADAIVDFCLTGKNSFKDMVNSMIKDLARMVVQQNFTGPLAKSISGLFGGGTAGGSSGGGFNWSSIASVGSSVWDWFTGSDTGSSFGSLSDSYDTISEGVGTAWDWIVNLFHNGGVVGMSGGTTRAVSPFLFANAPRLHEGLAADEYPAILQKGETVIPAGLANNPSDWNTYIAGNYFADQVSQAADNIATAGKTAGEAMTTGADNISNSANSIGKSITEAVFSAGGGFIGGQVGGPWGAKAGGIGGKLLGGYLYDLVFGDSNTLISDPNTLSTKNLPPVAWYLKNMEEIAKENKYGNQGNGEYADYGFGWGNVGSSGAAFSGGYYGAGYDSLGNDISTALGDQLHFGGVVGMGGGIKRRVDSSVFVGAPRLHRGLAHDEFPAILQKGETVIPKGQRGNSGKIVIPIIIDSREVGRAVIDNPSNIRHMKAATGNYGRTL